MSPARRRAAVDGWRKFVHHVMHPISSSIVLAAAGIELIEWFHAAAERILHLLELPPGSAGG